jgi:hypothetical protein
MIETEKQTDCHDVPPCNDDNNKQIAKLPGDYRNYLQGRYQSKEKQPTIR